MKVESEFLKEGEELEIASALHSIIRNAIMGSCKKGDDSAPKVLPEEMIKSPKFGIALFNALTHTMLNIFHTGFKMPINSIIQNITLLAKAYEEKEGNKN